MKTDSFNNDITFSAFNENKSGEICLIEDYNVSDSVYGRSELKTWTIDGISVGYTKHHFRDYFTLKKINDNDAVSLQFNLKGEYLISHLGKEYNVKAMQHNIIYTPGFDNSFMNKNLEAESFYIQISPDLFCRIASEGSRKLKTFADNVSKGLPAVLAADSLPINLELNRAINEVLNCRFSGSMKKIFMLSKIMEILVLQSEAYNIKHESENLCCKSSGDKEKIYFARDYLIKNIVNPPSLFELAKKTGINEYKLKRGFREIFNSTVFGFLAEKRLELGRQALLESGKTISEIAFELGYSSPQHFSNSFKKKFGVPPKLARK